MVNHLIALMPSINCRFSSHVLTFQGHLLDLAFRLFGSDLKKTGVPAEPKPRKASERNNNKKSRTFKNTVNKSTKKLKPTKFCSTNRVLFPSCSPFLCFFVNCKTHLHLLTSSPPLWRSVGPSLWQPWNPAKSRCAGASHVTPKRWQPHQVWWFGTIGTCLLINKISLLPSL